MKVERVPWGEARASARDSLTKSLRYFPPADRHRLLWKLPYSLKAFKPRAYILEDGRYLLDASLEFVIRQTENVSLKFLEMIGPRLSTNRLFNRYLSAHIHYAFTKPANHPPDGPEPRDPEGLCARSTCAQCLSRSSS